MSTETSTSEETLKTNPVETGSEEKKSEPSGEKETLVNKQPTDYASKSEEETNWKKRYQDSSREAQELIEYKKQIEVLNELSSKDPRILKWIEEAREGKVPQNVELEDKEKPPSSYDEYVQSLMKDNWSKATLEVEDEFPEIVKDIKIKERMLAYTKRNIIDRNGILFNPSTNKPYTPNELKNILKEGAIIASSDKLYNKAKNEGEIQGLANAKLNELATQSLTGTGKSGELKVDAPADMLQAWRRMGATDEEIPGLAKRWKETYKR